jgi:hypothetical protein
MFLMVPSPENARVGRQLVRPAPKKLMGSVT